MSWLTLDEVLNRVGQKKLSSLTLEAGERLLVGMGDALEDTFDLPFAAGGGILVYADAVLVADTGYTINARLGTGTRDQIVFDAAPGDGVRIDASATSGIAPEAVFAAMDQAQGLVTGRVRAAGFLPPTADATNAPIILKSWTLDIGAYFLVSQLRRAPLADAYPEIKARHDEAKKDLEAMADGKIDLGTWLASIDVTTETSSGGFIGATRVFGGTNGLA